MYPLDCGGDVFALPGTSPHNAFAGRIVTVAEVVTLDIVPFAYGYSVDVSGLCRGFGATEGRMAAANPEGVVLFQMVKRPATHNGKTFAVITGQ